MSSADPDQAQPDDESEYEQWLGEVMHGQPACDCPHPPEFHDPSGACCYINFTYGPCPCAATPPSTLEAQGKAWRAQQRERRTHPVKVGHRRATRTRELVSALGALWGGKVYDPMLSSLLTLKGYQALIEGRGRVTSALAVHGLEL